MGFHCEHQREGGLPHLQERRSLCEAPGGWKDNEPLFGLRPERASRAHHLLRVQVCGDRSHPSPCPRLGAFQRQRQLRLPGSDVHTDVARLSRNRMVKIGQRPREGIFEESVKREVSLGKPTEARDVTNAVVFLASNETSNIIGAARDVSGGHVMR